MQPPAKPAVIYLHPAAPPKPAAGAACNGCGVCCTWQPCPVGVLLSRRRHGACVALRFEPGAGRYVCGLLADPGVALRWLPLHGQRWLLSLVKRLARRWIAVGAGCDCDAEVALG